MDLKRVLVISDLHVGHSVGLWPGSHPIEGGGKYESNEFQKWMYQCWLHMIDEAKSMGKFDCIVNGDPIQGVNARDGGLIAPVPKDQVRAALTLLEPLRALAQKFYMIRGTEWHEGKAANEAEMLGQLLGAELDPQTAQYTRYEMFYAFEDKGPIFHFAHHVGCSSVPWYEATVPLRDMLLLLSEVKRFQGSLGPRIKGIVRSHRHRSIYVNAPPDMHALVTPAWQLKTSFSYKVSSSMLPQIGYAIIDYDGTDIIVRPRIFPLPDIHVEGDNRGAN